MIRTHVLQPFSFIEESDSIYTNVKPGHPCTVAALVLDPDCNTGVATIAQMEGCDKWNTIEYELIFGPTPPSVIRMLKEGQGDAAMKWVTAITQAKQLGVL
jgi:hypothetical protein